MLMTDTCINCQTIMPAVRDEHMAYGDTGVVIYSNSVLGARGEFRGRSIRPGRRADRPHAALRAFTWTPVATPRADPRHAHAVCTARLGHTRCHRRTACRRLLAGAGSVGLDRVPGSDELKHFGAALASYGSVALFHIVGITPEARHLDRMSPILRCRCARRSARPKLRALQQTYSRPRAPRRRGGVVATRTATFASGNARRSPTCWTDVMRPCRFWR